MKVRIIKENEGTYFAKVLNIQGVYAQGETIEDVISNLMDVYEMVIKFKKDMSQKMIGMKKLQKHQKTLKTLGFRSIEFAI